MHYKTICLGLLEEHPALYEQLRLSRTLLSTMSDKAVALRRYHDDWKDQLTLAKPDWNPDQIASQALELAIQDLRDDLLCESPPSGGEAEAWRP
jgi:hypothetical protein